MNEHKVFRRRLKAVACAIQKSRMCRVDDVEQKMNGMTAGRCFLLLLYFYDNFVRDLADGYNIFARIRTLFAQRRIGILVTCNTFLLYFFCT